MTKHHAWIAVFLWICSGLHLSAQTPDPETTAEVDSLCRSALALSDQGQFDPALGLIARAMDHAVQGKDTGYAELAVCWLNKGRIQTRKRDYPGAEQCFLEARAMALKAWGPNHPGYAQCLVDLGIFYNDLGRLKEAEQLLLEALPIWERSLGKAHVDYAWMMNNMGHLYFDMARYEEATAHYEEARSIREQTIGTAHPVYAGSLINLGMVYWKTGQMARAETSYLSARAIFEDELQDTGHRFYRNCLNNLSIVYNAQGKYEESAKLYIRVLELIETSRGRNNQDYATSLNNLGNLYYELGKLELARTCYVEALQIRRTLLGEDHPQVASTLNNLAALYDELGQYQDVESTMQEVLQFRAKALGTDHPDYAQSLSNLASFYEHTGNLEKAESLYRQVLVIMEKSFGKAHSSYAATLQNLANLNLKWQKYDRAEQLYLETTDILAGISGTDHPDYATALLNVGLVCLATGRVQKAEALLQQVRTIQEASIGQDHPEYARTIANLGEVAISQGDLETGEQYMQRSRKIWEKMYGSQHLDVTNIISRLAWVHEQQERSQDAEQDLGLLLDQVQSRLSTATSFLPEQELQAYVRTFRKIGDQIGECVQDRYARVEKVGKLPGLLYNYMLFHKGFLLNSAMRLKYLSEHTPASREIDLRLKSCRRRLARQYALPLADRRGVAELEEQALQAEKELIQSVAGFAEASRQLDWTDIRNVLKADQAAIEFMQYTRQAETPESSVEYAAIIIRPDRDQPEFVHLFSETEMGRILQTDTQRRSDYVNDLYAWADRGLIADEEPLPTLYQLIWSRIAATGLTGIQTIYYAPTGVLHRLNLGAIAVNDEQVLSDVYQLVEISSTRRLIENDRGPGSLANGKGVVFGGLYFDPDTLAVPNDDLLASRGQLGTDQAGKVSRTGSWSYLKWTEKEASAIKGILEVAGMACRELDGYEGSEEAFKQICAEETSPVVLHMATHGFFFPDPGGQDDHAQDLAFYGSDNPMIRSGLILAGGNQAWRNGHPLEAGQEDGILTAYEISQMDLSNTDLVVLSACETGLGDIQGNEGVYGLQRAFKIAGAKYLIMSLWQVPDRETMQFMTTFYSNWLEPGDGKQATIPEAFRKTQLEMRDRFFNPYSWAGFVLVE